MEHIIQIAVSVDDDRIAALAEQAAAKEIVKSFKDETGGYTRAWTRRLSEQVVEAIVSEMSADGYDDIAVEVASRLARSQRFREKVAAALAERGEL